MFNTKQGVFGPGGHGGGIFQTTVSGLGNTEYYILALQKKANEILPSIGQPTIKEDGILGPETCGAMRMIVASNKFPGVVPPPACANIPLDHSYEPIMSTGTKLAIVGVTIAIAAGGYWAWKKYL